MESGKTGGLYQISAKNQISLKKQIVKMIALCIIGIAINLAGSFLVKYFDWPIYLDTVGTVLIAVMSGYLPGIIVGLVVCNIM